MSRKASPPHPRGNKGRKRCVTSQKRLLKNQKSGKSPETFGPISGATIPFIRFKAIKLRNPFGFFYLENVLDQLFKQADCSLTTGVSGPKSFRNF